MNPILSLHVLMLVGPAFGFSHQQPGEAERQAKKGIRRLLCYSAACEGAADDIYQPYPRLGDHFTSASSGLLAFK